MVFRAALLRELATVALGVFLVLLLLFTLGALGHVAIHLQHLDVALALGQARRQQASLRERKRKLELEIGVLKDPERVLSIARERLALRPPAVSDIVALAELGARVREVLEAGEADPAATGAEGAR